MKKELLLIRHSEANQAYRGQTDADRALTDSGSVRAMQLANYLKNRNIALDALYSSKAERGRQTAELLGEKILKPQQEIIFSDDIYESSVRILLGLINNLEEKQERVCIVGHNPILTYLAEYVTGGVVEELEPCGVLWLRSEQDAWAEVTAGTMSLHEYISPNKLNQG